ncbi:MAG: glutamate 5-kinase [Pseudomonadales bacterium]|jgi:glutamate 5-kinase|nr:glutamate 5-kinase [Pseudomonadales bacterium]
MRPEPSVASGTLRPVDSAEAQAGRAALAGARRWVVKIGSALLTGDGRGLDRAGIDRWAQELAALRAAGAEVVLVSSGAIAEGVLRLGLARRPDSIHELQAAAAVGQMGLIQAWESAFSRHGLHTALILLTHDDLSDRARYLNSRSTLRTLLAHGVVPVVNENDTVATEEIRFGDNDTLGALVSNLVEADVLVLLTDQDGLRERDPREAPLAPLVPCARAGDPALDAMAGGSGGQLGRGGMATKLRAARLAARAGAVTCILDGRTDRGLGRLREGESLGTLLLPDEARLAARKRWIAGQLQTRGTLVIDAGAVRVLREQGRSLLPVGVREVRGRFGRGEVVVCVDEAGREVARGLVNYSSDETREIRGQASGRIGAILGYAGEPELIHRDDLVLA